MFRQRTPVPGKGENSILARGSAQDKDSVEQEKKKEEGQDIDPQRDTDKPAHSKNEKTDK